MITKEMLKRCLNETKQAFCALEKDVQDAINDNKSFQQCLYHIAGKISWENDDDEKPSPNYVYRLSTDTPTEPEAELNALFNRPKRVYRDRKDEYIRRCVELENTVRRLEAEREAAAKIGFGTLVKRWWRGGK